MSRQYVDIFGHIAGARRPGQRDIRAQAREGWPLAAHGPSAALIRSAVADPLRPFDATLTERPFPGIELTIRWSVGGSGNGKNVSGTPGAVGKAARLRRLSRTETRVWGDRIVEDVGARRILRTTKAEALATPRQPTSRETSAQTAE